MGKLGEREKASHHLWVVKAGYKAFRRNSEKKIKRVRKIKS